MNNVIAIPKLKFSEPSRNLPGRKGIATAEDRFTITFMRAYLNQASVIHKGSNKTRFAFAREIPVNGYGIADLYVIAWDAISGESFPDTHSFVKVAHPCTRAFECKLTDWKKGMAQTGRYRFFANQSILVLPEATYKKALPFIDTFKKIKVGLWSFDKETGIIAAHHTPRPQTAISEKYYHHAITCVAKASKRSLPIL